MISKKNIFRSWRICSQKIRYGTVLGALFFVLCSVLVPRSAQAIVMYFYYPDANLRDVAELKTQVQEYFKTIDSGIKLQAFLKRKDLEAAIRHKAPDLLLVASWVANDTKTRYGFKPLVVGQSGASKSYKKVLISKKAMPAGGSPTVSMVGLGGQDLKTLVPNLKKFPNLNIIEVSKDLDAVLAVSFDQVDLALVRSQNIDAIRSFNAMAVQGIKVLAKSAPIEYPIIAASPDLAAPEVQKFVEGVMTVKNAQSSRALALLGFDGWGKK